MQKIAVIPNEYRDPSLTETKRVAERIQSYGKTVLLDKRLSAKMGSGFLYGTLEEIMGETDAAVVLGGDGTILKIAPCAARNNVPLVGINFGNLGFLSQAEKGDDAIFEDLFSGNFTVRQTMMLSARVLKGGKESANYLALNDVVISNQDYSRMVHLNLSIDGAKANSYYADGTIIATPTGSTAYSLSAGGPIVQPGMDAMVITPICPHTLSTRAMVIAGSQTVEVSTSPPYRVAAVMTVDGRKAQVLDEDEVVEITRSQYRTSLIQLPGSNFFEILRRKLAGRQDD